MKSICIKTNNENLLNYLLNELDYIEIKPVVISTNKFKNYKNIIIHYSGNEIKKFIHEVSCILACLVIDELEESFIKKLILKNYFYFDFNERKHIVEMCFDIFTDDFNLYFDKKYNCLINDFESYLKNNKSIILDGFLNFRIKDYMSILEEVVDEAVNNFVIEKEYLEFISLLKMYVNSQKSTCDIVHLIYNNESSILLDKDKNIINVSDDVFKAKYLSDINKPVWIRHVLVPGINSDDKYLSRLDTFLKSLNNIQRVDILPYHTLGVGKWEVLGIPYQLNDVEPPSAELVQHAKEMLHVDDYKGYLK